MPTMKKLSFVPLVLFATACATVEAPPQTAPAAAQGFVTPPASLILDGVPPIAQSVADKVFPYGEFRPMGLWSRHPTKREMLIRRRLAATNQVFLVTEPGAAPVNLTDQAEPIGTAEYQPTTGDSFLYTRGEGGN